MSASPPPDRPRERSFWAWGWADRFPDEAARAGLARMAEAMLGAKGLALRPLPRLEDARLPPPRLPVPPALAAFATDDREARVRHTYGRAWPDLFRGLTGDFSAAPDLVAEPRDEGEVAAALAWASAEGVAVVPYGGGTSVVGGVERPGGDRPSLTLSLRRLDRVREVDPVSRLALIEAGATGPRLEAQLAAHGLTLRHYPQSFEHSTLGGWIATRAGGHFATLYTHIDDLVAGVRMVTPTGVLATRRLPASGAGPAPERLVLGSEGILGVITEAWMRVRPRPVHRGSATVRFASWEAAVEAVRAIAQAGLHPANCRLLDKREALLNQVPARGMHVLILGFESADHPQAGPLARALELALAHGGESDGPRLREPAPTLAGADPHDAPAEAGAWRAAFLDAPYLQSALASVGVLADTFETACPWDAFPALHAHVVARVREAMRAQGAPGIVTCRFTHVYPDGPAPYFTWLTPARPGQELAQWEAVKRAASDALAERGGTITHHHAVGRLHRPWYDRERSPAFARALRAAKRELDPAGVLNPGVLIDPA